MDTSDGETNKYLNGFNGQNSERESSTKMTNLDVMGREARQYDKIRESAAIVRIMKTRKQWFHQKLMVGIIEQLTGPFQAES
ncbi:hypothetical protein B9Z55_027946 [Caenorhabditis nigoni]|nr:hypothetical protein B9Z55_027946 [Caenorhabditis nigoni]